MRKFFQDYSSTGVVLIFCTLILGFLFRLFNLSSASAWGDEIASLFYAENLSEVFHHESHTPLYYSLCKVWMFFFGKSILALRCLFIILSFSLLSLSGILILRKKETGLFLLFVILWWLWPTDIIFSRQARHYGLYGEISFFYLIFWRYREDFNSKTLFVIGMIVQALHPFMIIPVWFLGAFDFIRKRLSFRQFLLVAGSSFPLVLYYSLRFLFYGQEKVMSNIGWIRDSFSTYAEGLFLLFAGDSFPFNQFYPLALSSSFLFIFVVVIILLLKTKPRESWLKFLAILLFSIAATELTTLVFSNVRIPRYSMYLLPFFLYALLDSINESRVRENLMKGGILFIVLSSYTVGIFRPWSNYDWDDQAVFMAKEFLKTLPEKQLVVCGNRYQLDYYFKKPNLTCSQVAIPLIRAKKPFYFFDINGKDERLSAYLLQEAQLSFVKKFGHSYLIGFEPRR
jgi:uncharacterized membrane protein